MVFCLNGLNPRRHQGNVFPLVSNINIPCNPWTGKLTRCNAKYVQKYHFLPAKPCVLGDLGCVLWGLSLLADAEPLPSARGRCVMTGEE